MKTKLRLLVIVFFEFAFVQNLNNLFSQQIDKNKLPFYFEEVYKNSEYKLTLETETFYSSFLDRVSFIQQPYLKNENYPLLSSVSKKDKYNSLLNYNLDHFIPENFNPLAYNFNYYENVTQFFRIDNTNYLLMILHY